MAIVKHFLVKMRLASSGLLTELNINIHSAS